MAPQKCGQLTFTKALNDESSDILNISLYNTQIPFERNPKFLGIIFDRRLNFKTHYEAMDKKLFDRINLLKILSYDDNWKLGEHILIRIYKYLVRSVIYYTCVTTFAQSNEVTKRFEIIQNDALRIILKKKRIDHVPIADLLEKDRHESLMEATSKGL